MQGGVATIRNEAHRGANRGIESEEEEERCERNSRSRFDQGVNLPGSGAISRRKDYSGL